LSWEEIEELEQVVGHLAMTKTMEQRMDHGSIVFEEVDTLQ
jgi:hypothetical protein